MNIKPNPYEQAIKKSNLQIIDSMIGKKVTRVILDQYQTTFLVDDIEIVVESYWRLNSVNGEIIDQKRSIQSRDSFELWKIIDRTVINSEIVFEPFSNLKLYFSGGLFFEVFGNDDGYEDWHVNTSNHGGILCNGTTY